MPIFKIGLAADHLIDCSGFCQSVTVESHQENLPTYGGDCYSVLMEYRVESFLLSDFDGRDDAALWLLQSACGEGTVLFLECSPGVGMPAYSMQARIQTLRSDVVHGAALGVHILWQVVGEVRMEMAPGAVAPASDSNPLWSGEYVAETAARILDRFGDITPVNLGTRTGTKRRHDQKKSEKPAEPMPERRFRLRPPDQESVQEKADD